MAYITATIDSSLIDSDLTNFPVGIKLNASDYILSGLGATDYEGFHFTVLSIECYAEIAIWDMSGEEAYIWVRVPSVLSASDVEIKIENIGDDNSAYVGVTGSTPAQTVWDSNFVGVYHMCQDPSGGASSILDSTSNSNDGTPNGSMTSGDLVDSGFGYAIDFDGVNDSINTGITTNYTTAQSFEIYTMPVSYANSYSFIFNKSSFYAVNVSDFPLTLYQDGSGYINFTLSIGNDFNWDVVLTSTDVVDIDEWAVISGTADTTVTKLYRDGVLDQSGSGVTISSNSRAYTFGQSAYPYAGGVGINEYNGRISEARISNIVRSASWIKATAQNLLNNLVSKTYSGDIPEVSYVYGKISISGKNVNIIGISVLEKGQWRTVEDTYMLIDNDWRLNIKS